MNDPSGGNDPQSQGAGILARPEAGGDDGPAVVRFEVFVQPRFSHLELGAVMALLDAANEVQEAIRFARSIVSDLPGLVANGDVMVRAEPAIEGSTLPDCLVIIGGEECNGAGWIKRVRAMQRHKRPVVVLSDAATEFVKLSPEARPATTHWRDIPVLNEVGDYSDLSTRLAEFGNGVLTCAGRGHAVDVMFSLLGELLNPYERSEMASLLVLDGLRGFHREQPRGQAQGNAFLQGPLKRALQLMEDTIEEPLPMSAIARQVGASPRQLERLFKIQLSSSPARTYKKIRLKRAQSLVVETRMPLVEIAIACGFSGTTAMSKAFRQVFGVTPNQIRGQEK